MARLDPLGYFVYGGYEFKDIIESKLVSVPYYGNTKSERLYDINTWSVKFLASADSFKPRSDFPHPWANNTDSDLDEIDRKTIQDTIRNSLLRPNYNLIIDTPTCYLDATDTVNRYLVYGPKPISCTIEPLPGNEAMIVDWVVEWGTTKDELNNIGKPEDYSIAFSTSKVSIKPNGYRQIVDMHTIYFLTQTNQHDLGRIFNLTKKTLLAEPIHREGFLSNTNIDIAEDRMSAKITHTYDEIESPNVYPVGVVSIKATHNLRSSVNGGIFEKGFNTWANSMKIEIELARDVLPYRAWYIMTLVLNERLKQSIVYEDTNSGFFIGIPFQRRKVPIVLSVNIEENIYEHKYSLDVSWVVSVDPTKGELNKLFGITGMFSPVNPKNTWKEHANSLTVIQYIKGLSGSFISEQGKVIRSSDYSSLDAYKDGIEGFVVQGPYQNLSLSFINSFRPFVADAPFSLFGINCPPPDSSWLVYENKFTLVTRSHKVTHEKYKLEEEVTEVRKRKTPEPDYDTKVTLPKELTGGAPEDFYIQKLGADNFKLIIRGAAARMGGPTNPPTQITIGGKIVELNQNDSYISHQQATSGPCPMVISKWELHYDVYGKPDDVFNGSKSKGNGWVGNYK